MTEYIDLEAAVGFLEAFSRNADCECVSKKLIKAAKRLKAIPAADVAPVRHGRWLWNALAKPFCSECGVETWIASNFALPNYCPHCGARMDGAK